MKFNEEIQLENKVIGFDHPVLFIADIAANHDGDLERAKELIYLAAKSGADVAKFQHFNANTIVSEKGFRSLGGQSGHQKTWDKSVFDVYQEASLNNAWTPILKETCQDAGIIFMTSPYSFDLVDSVEKYVSAYKIGSGDISWGAMIEYISQKNKPVLLATGASSIEEVTHSVRTIHKHTSDIVLMQCNTNYTADKENFKYINLNVLKQYEKHFPGVILGLSDHTAGHVTVLGAVALGARVIEKHFTDNNNRVGPDHAFAMDPDSWKDMVNRTRELEEALGSGKKKVEINEEETVVLQRRAYYFVKNYSKGEVVKDSMLEALRPSPPGAVSLNEVALVFGKPLCKDVVKGESLLWNHLS